MELDVEVEMAAIVGLPSEQFKRIPITEAEDHIFGIVLLNDWSSGFSSFLTSRSNPLPCGTDHE